ncbi:MAG: CDP-archaeol synthase [Sulfurifustaceae bacterium]
MPATKTMTFGDLLVYLELLLLLGIANGTPLFTNTALRQRFNRPLDGGRLFFDGRPLFGPSKTVRGVVAALVLTPLAGVALGLDVLGGLLIALFAMIGDLCSSFTKRRLGLPSSSQAIGLDQIPESLFPLIAVRHRYDLDALEIAVLVVLFVVLELLFSRVLFRLRLRDRPY